MNSHFAGDELLGQGLYFGRVAETRSGAAARGSGSGDVSAAGSPASGDSAASSSAGVRSAVHCGMDDSSTESVYESTASPLALPAT